MRLFLPLFLLMILSLGVFAQQSHIQFIHNSPTLGTNAGPVVDIYVNGQLRPPLTGFEFREATGFLSFEPQSNVQVDVRMNPSTVMDDPILTFEILELEEGESYTLMLGGVNVSIPQLPPFNFFINNGARRMSTNPNTVVVNAFHGGIILPRVDIGERSRGSLFNMTYGNYANYQTLDNESYFLFADVQNFGFPFNYVADLRSYGGQAITLFVSGAALNSPEWGIFAATANGEVFELPLTLLATMQLFNNVAGDNVDIYLDSVLWVEDLPYQSAIPYTVLESERVLEFGIAPAGSESYDDVFATVSGGFQTDRFYTTVLNGSRDTMPFPLSLDINLEVRQMAENPNQFDFNLFHGLQDSVDLALSIKGIGPVLDSLSYGTYSDYFSLDTSRYFLDVREDSTGDLRYSFILDLPAVLVGNAVTLVLSGHPDDAAGVKMFALFADGSTFELERLLYGQVQFINNIPGTNLGIYINGELLRDSLGYRKATGSLLVPADEEVTLALVRVQDGSVAEAFVTFQVEVTDTLLYTMVLNGIIGNDEYPLELVSESRASLPDVDEDEVNYLFYHGVYGIDSLDISFFDGTPLLVDFPYKTYSDDFSSPNELTYFSVGSSTDDDVAFTYEGDFSGLGGSAIKLLFSGSRGTALDMVLLGVLSNGTVFELRETSLAQVQFIHRLAGVPIDVYLDDELFLEDFTPDTATEYLNIEGGGSYQIGIAPSGSASVTDTIASFEFAPIGGQTYTIIAAGLPETEDRLFDLFVCDDSQVVAGSDDSVDLKFFHSTFFFDTIHFELVYEGSLVDNFEFGTFTPYQTVGDQYYLLKTVSQSGGFEDFIVELDLRQLDGQSITLIFSEDEDDFLNPRILAVLANGEVRELPRRNLSRAQFIQNVATSTVDLYINDYLIRESFEYGEAMPFIDVVADVVVKVKLKSSDDDTEILNSNTNFLGNLSQIVFINGSLSNDQQPVRLSVLDAAREQYVGDTDSLDFAFHHGAPALNTLDLILADETPFLAELPRYGFRNYRNIDNFLSLLNVVDHETESWVASFLVDFRTLNNEVIMGWINESTGNPERYSIFLAFPDGTVIEWTSAGEARVQVLHNAPTAAVDVYLNGQLLLEEFGFLTATPFVAVPADVPLEIAITMHGDADVIFSTTVQLEDEVNYLLVANGIVGNTDTPFDLLILENARRSALENDQTDIAFLHGAPDAPALTFDSRNFGLLVDELDFGQFSAYLSLENSRYLIDLKDQLSGDLIESYEADFSGLPGRAGLIFASGVEGDSLASFGLYLLLDSGLVIPLSTISLANVQFIHNAITTPLDIYYGGDKILEDVEFRTASTFLELPAFPGLDISIAPAGSQGPSEAFYSLEPNFENSDNYIVFAYGTPGSFNPIFDFGLNIIEQVRLESAEDNSVDVFFYHAAFLLPGIDLNSEQGELIFRDIRYNELSDYASLIAAAQTFGLNASGTGNLLGNYLAPLDEYDGEAFVIFASGVLGDDPEFELWVARTNGITFPLEFIVSTTDHLLDVEMEVFPNPASSNAMIRLSLDRPMTDIRMNLLDMQGRILQSSALGQLPVGQHTIELKLDNLPVGPYLIRLSSAEEQAGLSKMIIKK